MRHLRHAHIGVRSCTAWHEYTSRACRGARRQPCGTETKQPITATITNARSALRRLEKIPVAPLLSSSVAVREVIVMPISNLGRVAASDIPSDDLERAVSGKQTRARARWRR